MRRSEISRIWAASRRLNSSTVTSRKACLRLRAQRSQGSGRGRPQLHSVLVAVLQPAREGLEKTLVEAQPRRQVGENRRIGEDGLQDAGDGGVSSHLAARQKPGEAAQVWQMGGNLIGERHVDVAARLALAQRGAVLSKVWLDQVLLSKSARLRPAFAQLSVEVRCSHM